MPTKPDRYIDGEPHAKWCAAVASRDIDDCDCDPCTCCEGAGSYGDDNGDPMTCIQCDGLPFKRRGERRRCDG